MLVSKAIQWDSIVSYDDAIDLLSTDQCLREGKWTMGTNARNFVSRLTNDQLAAYRHGAWLCNEQERYVAYSSLLRHNRSTTP